MEDNIGDVLSRSKDVLNPLNNITQAIKQTDQKIIANEAYVKYTNLEIDKLNSEIEKFKEQLEQLHADNKKLIAEGDRLYLSINIAKISLNTASDTYTNLTQQKFNQENKLQTLIMKYKTAYERFLKEYSESKTFFETHNPLYIKCKQAETDLLKMNIHYKRLLREIECEKIIQNDMRGMQKKMFHSSIVDFAQTVLDYKQSQGFVREIQENERKEAQLMEEYKALLKELDQPRPVIKERVKVIPRTFELTAKVPSLDSFINRSTTVSSPSSRRTAMQEQLISKVHYDKEMLQNLKFRTEQRKKLSQQLLAEETSKINKIFVSRTKASVDSNKIKDKNCHKRNILEPQINYPIKKNKVTIIDVQTIAYGKNLEENMRPIVCPEISNITLSQNIYASDLNNAQNVNEVMHPVDVQSNTLLEIPQENVFITKEKLIQISNDPDNSSNQENTIADMVLECTENNYSQETNINLEDAEVSLPMKNITKKVTFSDSVIDPKLSQNIENSSQEKIIIQKEFEMPKLVENEIMKKLEKSSPYFKRGQEIQGKDKAEEQIFHETTENLEDNLLLNLSNQYMDISQNASHMEGIEKYDEFSFTGKLFSPEPTIEEEDPSKLPTENNLTSQTFNFGRLQNRPVQRFTFGSSKTVTNLFPMY